MPACYELESRTSLHHWSSWYPKTQEDQRVGTCEVASSRIWLHNSIKIWLVGRTRRAFPFSKCAAGIPASILSNTFSRMPAVQYFMHGKPWQQGITTTDLGLCAQLAAVMPCCQGFSPIHIYQTILEVHKFYQQLCKPSSLGGLHDGGFYQ